MTSERVRNEQVKLLFDLVTPAVVSAAFFATVFVLVIRQLGYLNPAIGIYWLVYMIFCGTCHIAIARLFKYTDPTEPISHRWAAMFTIICLAEGIGWGCLGFTTYGYDEFDALILLSAGGVAAGCIPAFSPYLPALFAFIIPTIIIHASISLTSNGTLHLVFGSFLILYTVILIVLGLFSNRSIKHGIRHGIRLEEMTIALRHQKELAERARKTAEQANLDKSHFLAAASHDLRQPFHALNLFVGALHEISMPPEGRKIVNQIEALTDALDKLFAALLDISKLDAGIIEVNFQVFKIDTVLSRVCEDFMAEASAKGLLLKYVPSRVAVNSDPVLVERIARNFISNAIRYTDSGKIVVGCRHRGTGIAVQVLDTGIGIAPHQQELIFQEYYQLGNAERNRNNGLGLGLAIVRRLAQLLGSSVTLRSVPTRGSCFEILLEGAESLSVSPAFIEIDRIDIDSAGAFIVVIDDEMTIRTGMSILLSNWGYDVVVASSTDEAIAILGTELRRPDLLICDFRLRGEETGIDAIHRLRTEYNETIPAVLISGDIAADRLVEARLNGLTILHKPVSNFALKNAITGLIAAGPEL